MKNLKTTPLPLIMVIMLISIGMVVSLPIDVFLVKMSLSDFQSEYFGLTIKMGFIFIISYYIIRKMKIEPIAGLSRTYIWKFKYLNIFPIYLIILGVLNIVSKDLIQIQLQNIILLLIACLAVGFAEEFFFRGLLQSLFLKAYGSHKNGIIISTISTAMIFGIFHLVNLTQNDNVMAVLVQVVFATFIGFFFGVLVLKTNKIVPIAITHGLINFFFSIPLLPSLGVIPETGYSIVPIILTLPLFITGFIIVKKIEKEDVIKKLNQSFK